MTTPLPSRHSRYAAHGLLRAAYLLLLTAATAAFVYPLVWLVSASLKPKSQVFDNRPIPRDVQWSNLVEVWNAGPRAALALQLRRRRGDGRDDRHPVQCTAEPSRRTAGRHRRSGVLFVRRDAQIGDEGGQVSVALARTQHR